MSAPGIEPATGEGPELSAYAQHVIGRPPDVIGRELDRLQRKLGVFRSALHSCAAHGSNVAKNALREAERI